MQQAEEEGGSRSGVVAVMLAVANSTSYSGLVVLVIVVDPSMLMLLVVVILLLGDVSVDKDAEPSEEDTHEETPVSSVSLSSLMHLSMTLLVKVPVVLVVP